MASWLHLKNSMLPLLLLAVSMNPPKTVTIGEPLSALKGEFLTGKPAVLPDAAKGKVALLALGFTYASRFPVEAWVGRFRKDFDHNPAVTFYEIPLIGGMARMGKWFIDSGMRRGTPVADRENVITVYGGVDAWKTAVDCKDPNQACLLLLDQRGVVQWRYAGKFDDKIYAELAEQVHRLTTTKSADK